MVVSPGESIRSGYAGEVTELFADEDTVANIDQTNHWDLKADEDGKTLFPALIPGATYRFIQMKNDKATVTDFTVKPGETRNLGEFVIESEE